MAGAYYEKLARINLTTGEIKVEKLDLDLAHKFIGGRGLGTKMLYDDGIAAVDPLSPANEIIYITGPMTGSNSPSSGRYMVVTKSPLTGMIASANSGGIWGAKLKFAGWDAIIVEGRADKWTYISIVDDKIELHDASEYVGLMSDETDDKLNWQYVRMKIDVEKHEYCEFQCMDKVWDMRGIPMFYREAYGRIDYMINPTIWVEGGADRSVFLYLDSVLISME